MADKPLGGPGEPVLAHLETRAGRTRQVWKGRLRVVADDDTKGDDVMVAESWCHVS